MDQPDNRFEEAAIEAEFETGHREETREEARKGVITRLFRMASGTFVTILGVIVFGTSLSSDSKNSEYNVSVSSLVEKIPNNELYFVSHTVHPGVVASHVDLVDVKVHSDDPVAGQCELYGVAAHPAETVHHYPAPHHLGDVSCDLLWGHGVP